MGDLKKAFVELIEVFAAVKLAWADKNITFGEWWKIVSETMDLKNPAFNLEKLADEYKALDDNQSREMKDSVLIMLVQKGVIEKEANFDLVNAAGEFLVAGGNLMEKIVEVLPKKSRKKR